MKIKLGMPHLIYNGIDPVWLAKTLGDAHWNLLKSIKSFNQDNQRLYASFFAFEIDFNRGQDQFYENNELNLESKIFKFNNQIYRSTHAVSVERNLASATFDSIFVKKDIVSGALIKDDPVGTIKDIDKINTVFLDEHKRIKKQLFEKTITGLTELVFSPEVYFNGVKILYCANYLNLVFLNEWNTYKQIQAPIKKIKLFFFKNINVGDQVFGITECRNNCHETVLMANDHPLAFCEITR